MCRRSVIPRAADQDVQLCFPDLSGDQHAVFAARNKNGESRPQEKHLGIGKQSTSTGRDVGKEQSEEDQLLLASGSTVRIPQQRGGTPASTLQNHEICHKFEANTSGVHEL